MSLYADSSENAAAMVPSDTVNQPTGPFNKIYVGTGGNISVVTQGGQTTLFTGVLAGATLSIRGVRVNATLTTATNMNAMW